MTELSTMPDDEFSVLLAGVYDGTYYAELRRRLAAKDAEIAALTEQRDGSAFLKDCAESALRSAEQEIAALRKERDEAVRQWGWKKGAAKRLGDAEHEVARLRDALYRIEREAGHRHWGSDPTKAEAWVCPKCIARAALSEGGTDA